MPNAANLVVKDAANVDKTFTLMTPASGDSGLAEFALKEGASPVAYPKFTFMAKRTANRSRKTQGKIRVPFSFTDPTTGVTRVITAFEFNFDCSVADDFPDSVRDNAVAYTANIVGHTLVKACLRDGYGMV